MLLALILALVGAIAIGLMANWPTPAPTIGFGVAASIGVTGLLLFGAVSLLVGYWWLTLPDPGSPDVDQDQKARRMGRIGLLGALVAGVMTGPLARILPTPALVAPVCGVTAAGLLIVGSYGFFGYLARLCERIPDVNLSARSRSVRKGLVACLALYLATALLNGLLVWILALGGARPRGAPIGMMAPGCVGVLIFLFLLVYLDRALRLLTAVRTHLRGVLDEALRNWNEAAPSAPPVPPVDDA